MKHILCAVDFSDASAWAVARAVAAAQGAGCGLRLLNVKGIDDLGEVEKMHALAQRAQARGVPCQTDILEGDPAQEILAAGEEPGCELIVIGPARPRTIGAWLLGTTGEKVIRASRRAVLAVHGAPAADEGRYRRALACLDFGDASRAALRDALLLGLTSADRLAIVHAYLAPLRHVIARVPIPAEDVEQSVLEAGNEATLGVRAILTELGVVRGAPPVYVREGDVADAIADAIAKWDPDLLVMGAHGRAPVVDLFLGGAAQEALRSAPCDVLVRRAEAAPG